MRRKNNFDLVRLALATIVVLVHSYDLSLSPALHVVRQSVSSELAVEGFFAISGFLIFASYERSRSLRQYFANRAWRILPGYWFSTLLCVSIGLAMGGRDVTQFLLANLTFSNFLHPGIPGVFAHNPGNDAMNGALWTIKIEIMFYLSVPVIVWLCRRMGRDLVLVTFIVASLAFRVAFDGHGKVSAQLPGQLCFFLVGTLVFYHQEQFERHGRWIMTGAALLFALYAATGWSTLRPFWVGILIMGACLLLPHAAGPTRWGDFSYGTYIVHYPIVQVMVAMGLFRDHPWAALSLLIAIVAAVACFSWFVVEKPALLQAKSGRLRHAAFGESVSFPTAVS